MGRSADTNLRPSRAENGRCLVRMTLPAVWNSNKNALIFNQVH
jgi:hypothetical protein